MSRSVKPDYDKMFEVRKLSATIRLTDEQFFDLMAFSDKRFERKAITHVVAPTNEDWGRYHRAKSGLLALRNYEGTEGLEFLDIPMPKPKAQFTFTETNEEWLARCRTLQAERKAA